MILRNTSLGKRVFLPTLGLFTVAMAALVAIQHTLYVRGFETTLGRVEDSSLAVKREGAQGLLQGVRVSTERLLQTGEYQQFSALADLQRQQSDIDEISFIGPSRKTELASPADRAGRALDGALWEQAQKTKDVILVENNDTLSMYQPLYVDADMRRLKPELEVGGLYGLLHVEFSKNKINGMLADARGTFQSAVTRSLWVSGGLGGAALLVMAVALFPLVVRPLVRSLKVVITNLTGRAGELVDISRQIAGSSQRLSDSASEEASSLEETSSAMEEMAAMTRTNAENAQQANSLATEAQKSATEGDQTMGRLNQAMTAINESSAKISKIIKVIEEIAFQTNLLALNAAVEAARAGDHGRGFAVVAEEVRNLARRAAEAARETTTLIEDSVKRSRDGKQVVDEAGKSLGAIVQGATRMSELVSGIAKASEEQARGVEQVNAAVTQMNKMTQDNASEAQASSSVAQDLGEQARTVKGMVEELVGIVDGRRGRRASATTPLIATGEPEKPAAQPAPPTRSRRTAAKGNLPPAATPSKGLPEQFGNDAGEMDEF